MSPTDASIIFAVGILGLFYLDRDTNARTSKALWIPTAWVFINSSRTVSMWLGMAPTAAGGSTSLEGSPLDRIVFMALVAAGVAVVVGRKAQVGPIFHKNWPVMLFFSFAAFSILWSDYPFVTFKHWIKGIGDVVMVLIVLTEPVLLDATKRLITRVGFLLVPLSVLFCKYYPGIGSFVDPKSWALEYTGVATQKNSLGGLCLIFGLGLLWRFRSAYNDRDDPGRKRRLVALGAVLGMVAWLLWMCNSMTSICGLLLAGGVMVLAARSVFYRRPILVHVLVATVLGIALYALFFQSSGSLVEDLGRNPTLTGRTEVWSDVLSIPVNRLVGAGYETFWLGHRLSEMQIKAGFDINEAHNGYLEIFLNLGWVGVVLLAGLIVAGYRNAVRAYRRDVQHGSLRMAYFLAAIITSLTEAAFNMMAPGWIFFLLATTSLPEVSVSGMARGSDLAEQTHQFGNSRNLDC